MRVEPFLCDVAKRHPRSVQEWLGPYASSKITEPVETVPLVQKIIYALCAVAVAVVVVGVTQ